MVSLTLLDHCSLPGNPARANEDAFGTAGNFAWVIDGATGVGAFECLEGPSDAAWLSATASEILAERIGAGTDDLRSLLAETIDLLAQRFDEAVVRPPEARHQRPTAAILIARFDPDGIEAIELGDCLLIARGGEGRFGSVGLGRPGREVEQAAAKQMHDHGATLDHPEVRRRMREGRDRHNTPEGYWIFGLDPEVVDHARTHRLDLAASQTALLATDGFAALFEDYGRYSPEAALEAATSRGLAALGEELRMVEHGEDPSCRRYPRFKVSDDATALLVRGRFEGNGRRRG
ncbi:protein phosphatase 2C domain-containing protein [Amorphus sp. 3PC139-8]|uniref:protein phosphatase 2C domain-containing protein n=1 Tax=Amorphus sp. 3PC139-8 TaxID=2735676 RepID=UPI00345DFA2C